MTFTEFTDLINDSDSSWREKYEFMKIRLKEILDSGDAVKFLAASLDAHILLKWITDTYCEEMTTQDQLDFVAFSARSSKDVSEIEEDKLAPEQQKDLLNETIGAVDRMLTLDHDREFAADIIKRTVQEIQRECENEEMGWTEDDIDFLMDKVASYRKALMKMEDVHNGAQSNMDQYFLREYGGLKKDGFKKW